ncbi:DUF4276 family protein [Corynebacterium cystitidis]|uniref:DUF4276 family protein n=1 Tax=Corynebacterium cystitidis TaxID=35757 RepID=UPI00211DB719|nr:DUF4276 family protein [Corynebacterium cystitidis]
MSYRQIAIICEGQTEQAFTEQILGPYLAQRCYEHNIILDVRPTIVHTGVLASGAKAKGGGDWPKWKDRIQKTLGGSHWTVVTMMMDYYGCPKNIPGLTGKHSATEVEQLIRATVRT